MPYNPFEELDVWIETMALLKILALGNSQIETGHVELAADVIKRLRERNNPANVFGRDAG